MSEKVYAGFWIRTAAALIDSILMFFVFIPILIAIYGIDSLVSGNFTRGFVGFLINYILPAFAVIIFWIYKSATPGKMATGLSIVDAKTGEKPSTKQFIGRYLSYYVSMLPFFLGIFWVGIDKRKQGWHDKLAGTVVIKNKAEAVTFDKET